MSFSFPVETVSEGIVEIVVPRLEAFVRDTCDYAPSKAPVFYNPMMESNRDVAVLTLQAFQRTVGRKLEVCEPLTGCGVRGIRFAGEVNGVQKVVVNDINDEAYGLAKFNVEKNGFTRKIATYNEDANLLLSRFAAPKKRFDYVDIDPFGSPMPYVDSALRALRRGGMLALTATDLAPLCGVHAKACIRKYGGKPLRTEYCHELAVRLLAGALARATAKYDVGVRVVFGYSLEHYVRLYAVISYGAKDADASLENMGYVEHCFACFHREVSIGMFRRERKKCPECGGKLDFAGPLWVGELNDESFVASIEQEARTRSLRHMNRIRWLLSRVKEETETPITYFVVDKICDKLGVPVPSVERVIEILKERGFWAGSTHFNSRGVKTDAPAKVVTEAVAELV